MGNHSEKHSHEAWSPARNAENQTCGPSLERKKLQHHPRSRFRTISPICAVAQILHEEGFALSSVKKKRRKKINKHRHRMMRRRNRHKKKK